MFRVRWPCTGRPPVAAMVTDLDSSVRFTCGQFTNFPPSSFIIFSPRFSIPMRRGIPGIIQTRFVKSTVHGCISVLTYLVHGSEHTEPCQNEVCLIRRYFRPVAVFKRH